MSTARALLSRPEAVVAAVTVVAACVAIAVFESERAPGSDGQRYLEMAESPGAQVEAPYVTRLVGPLLVWALPVDEELGFRMLVALSLAVAGALAYVFLQGLTGSWRRAAGGVFVFLAGASTPNIRDPFLIDALSFALLMAMLVAAARNRWWWLVGLAPLALLTRDALMVIVAPALIVLAVGHRDAWVPLVLAGAATAAVGGLVYETSLVLGFEPARLNNFSSENIDAVLEYERQSGSLGKVAFSSVLFAYGAVWLAPLLAAKEIGRDRRSLAAAAAGVLAIMLAPFVTDWTRALTFAFPLIAVGIALLPGAHRLAATFSIAAGVAVMNFGAQSLSGGVLKYGLEIGISGALLAILISLMRSSNEPEPATQ